MQSSQKLFDFLGSSNMEGNYLHAYRDPIGIPTIGKGHTGPDVYMGQTITNAQSDALLAKDLQTAEALVNKYVTVPLSQNQFDAMVSIMFNVGPGKAGVKDGIVTLKSGNQSTLLRKLNAGDYAGAAAQFLVWNHAGGQVLAGLTHRRNCEMQMFLNGNYSAN